MLLFLTINLGQMVIGQASFCPDPNGIQMIVVGILIALLIAVIGGMIVASYLIASTMLAGLSWVGLITGGFLVFFSYHWIFILGDFLG